MLSHEEAAAKGGFAPPRSSAATLMWLPINWVADVAHIGLTRRLGVGQLGSPSKSSDGGLPIYDWSVELSISPSIFLVHDDTDEIAVPITQPTQPPSSESGFAEECAGGCIM